MRKQANQLTVVRNRMNMLSMKTRKENLGDSQNNITRLKQKAFKKQYVLVNFPKSLLCIKNKVPQMMTKLIFT